VILTDTHCHLDLEVFDSDRRQVIERAIGADVTRMLVPSLNAASAQRVVELATGSPHVFAAVGIHPTETKDMRTADLRQLRRLAAWEDVVAIGEIGLDYFWIRDREARQRQQGCLQDQLALAADLDLPVVLHMREENDALWGDCAVDMLGILENWIGGLRAREAELASRPGVLHSFSGSRKTALEAIRLGMWIGVTGPITYPNAEERRGLIGGLPLERLLIETDSPYLAPQQHRGKRNEPAYVTHIADRIAQVQSTTRHQIAASTSANAARLFAWGDPD
jgi:TatD DNase family protein